MYDMFEDDEEQDLREERINARARRKLQRPRRDVCEFCGTSAPEHNVKRRGEYMFCDNPVCNAVDSAAPDLTKKSRRRG